MSSVLTLESTILAIFSFCDYYFFLSIEQSNPIININRNMKTSIMTQVYLSDNIVERTKIELNLKEISKNKTIQITTC